MPPSQWRDRVGITPNFPDALEHQNDEAEAITGKKTCQEFFLSAQEGSIEQTEGNANEVADVKTRRFRTGPDLEVRGLGVEAVRG